MAQDVHNTMKFKCDGRIRHKSVDAQITTIAGGQQPGRYAAVGLGCLRLRWQVTSCGAQNDSRTSVRPPRASHLPLTF